MPNLRFLTAGESHGKALLGIIEGIPANLPISSSEIDIELKRRQQGYGRGGRMKIESDHAEIISGVRWGKTIGSPITLLIENRDYKNWLEGMSVNAGDEGLIPAVTRPRPGHADLAGALKYNQHDIRNILERSSARETAMRVALGTVARKFLSEFGIRIGSYVIQIGSIKIQDSGFRIQDSEKKLLEAFSRAEKSPVRCPDEKSAKKMVELVKKAIKEGNSLGGVFEVFVTGIPAGIGTHIQWDKRLDGRLAQALMSVQAIKGIEVGSGFEMARHSGSEVMDEIYYGDSRFTHHGFFRKTNNAGGIEGGITNGMPIILRAAMKPIPTLKKPLRSVDIATKEGIKAAYERSDVCAVPAASVIGEAMTALIIADAFLDKFCGDSMEEARISYNSYLKYIKFF